MEITLIFFLFNNCIKALLVLSPAPGGKKSRDYCIGDIKIGTGLAKNGRVECNKIIVNDHI